VNQQDLANSVGSVREVVARILAEFRAEELVRTSPGHVEILDPLRATRTAAPLRSFTMIRE
jgi:CRP/FNR family transcriptional regulator